jgi:hypothetical protein
MQTKAGTAQPACEPVVRAVSAEPGRTVPAAPLAPSSVLTQPGKTTRVVARVKPVLM